MTGPSSTPINLLGILGILLGTSLCDRTSLVMIVGSLTEDLRSDGVSSEYRALAASVAHMAIQGRDGLL